MDSEATADLEAGRQVFEKASDPQYHELDRDKLAVICKLLAELEVIPARKARCRMQSLVQGEYESRGKISDMIRRYSRRLLLPYVGVIQIVELGWARALSLDGKNWAIRYALLENKDTLSRQLRDDPRVNLSLVVTIEGDQLETRVIRPILDHEQLHADSQRLFEAIHGARLPFEAADRYEYWLLDSDDDSPLALLHSCVDEEEMQLPVPPPEWLAMPAAELEVRDPSPPDTGIYVPPVNYRLEKLIEERAGSKPRAAWFDRTDPATNDFPSCLIRDKWADPECQRVCDLYINRLAPRLLMMGGLSSSVRQRLEQVARDHVFDVEKFYPVYPEVIDDSVLNAARVEARLRRANEA